MKARGYNEPWCGYAQSRTLVAVARKKSPPVVGGLW